MELDLATQSDLVAALMRPAAFSHAATDRQHLQTHISHVLLVGDFAYKIKKTLNLGFLDFSTLARRKFCCEEELRLNSRLAAGIYLQVVPITGTLQQPHMNGAGQPLDYAVKMRRFPQHALLSMQQADAGTIDLIAESVAAFHRQIPHVETNTDFGEPEHVLQPMLEDFKQIRVCMDDTAELARLTPLEDWTRATCERLKPLLLKRKNKGHIRECHGDMHQGNIALIEDKPVIFDGIEFNPNLRWIDTINEVAFLIMDLQQTGQKALAWRFLNRYLELNGDYEAVRLLDFYRVYRALVRAKVTAIRLTQPDLASSERPHVMNEYRRYITLAENTLRRREYGLLITRGVSGSGKTYASGQIMEQIGAVRLRSDIERKRLFGLGETEDSQSAVDGGIYDKATGERTYGRLLELARLILQAGYPVLVDATFLKQSQRQTFEDLAEKLKRPYVILNLQAPEAELRRRISQRQAAGSDASEADLSVLQRQLTYREDLSRAEQDRAINIDSSQTLPLERIHQLITQDKSASETRSPA